MPIHFCLSDTFAVDLCRILEPPENGEIVAFTNERRAGSVVVYQCNLGYQIANGVFSTTRLCRLNGSWSEQDPTCEGESRNLI